MKYLALFLAIWLLQGCTGLQTVPSPKPGATPSPAPQATPYPPAGSSDGRVDTVCTALKPTLTVQLRNAMNLAKAKHPEILSDANGQPGDTYVLKPKDWNTWYWAVVDQLKDFGVDAILDDCGGAGACGEIALKLTGTVKGTGTSEQYQALYSSGQIPLETFRYRGTCKPSWFNAWK